ncbi:MAG: hypothetical protein ACRBFS_11115 [Aureispira sp.]
MPEQLSTGAQQALISLKKNLRTFLKGFAKLSKTDAAYSQYRGKVNAMRNLYFEIDALDLVQSTAAPAAVVTANDTPKKEEVSQTPKESRKQRREERKKARKAQRAVKKAQRAAEKVERRKHKGDKTGNKEESVFRFEKLKAVWDSIKFEEITENFREYLDQAEQFLSDARNYIAFVETYLPGQFTDEVDEVQVFITKVERFLTLARNVSQQVDRYAKLAADIVNVITTLPSKVEDLKDGIVEEATRVFAAAKNFISTTDTSDPENAANVTKLQEYLDKGERKLSQLEGLVGMITEDKDKDNLPDWYNRLEEKYNAIFNGSTDLVPGTTIDDAILLKIVGLKKSVDEFIAKASDKVEEFQELIQNAQQWLGELSKFTEAITGFVENIKDGDLAEIYQDLKEFKGFIDSDKDLFKGTNVDNKLKDKLQEYSKKAETWLMNKLTGGDPSKHSEVREILGVIDTLILSTGGVVDHSSKYEKDDDRINIPDINDVSQVQVDDVLERYGIRDTNASYEGILSDMKDQADATIRQAGEKFKDSAKRGAQASSAFRDAKEEYDQAVKKHNDYFRATNILGKKIINGLLSVAGLTIDSFVPGGGTVLKAVGSALLGEFTAINREIDKLLPSGFSFISDLAKDMLPAVLPQFASEKGLIEIEGKELLQGLNELYNNGIAARYQEVLELLNTMKANASNLSKNLRAAEQAQEVDEEALTVVKKKVIILELKWKGLQKDIMEKYVNLTYPPINQKKAYRYASRYLYSVWLIKFPQKEIRIGNGLIGQFDKFGILNEANVEWKTGFLSKLGRSFFGFFGADPHDYRDKIQALKRWANDENDRLKTAQAWSKVF